jgi:Putative Ig domain
MKKSLLLLISICGLTLLNSCAAVYSPPPPPPFTGATYFSVTSAASAPTAGTAFNFTVTALDSSNKTYSSYSGTVHFTSTDAKAVLPADAPLTNGTASFSATLKTAGAQTITATANIAGSSNSIIVSAAAVSQLSLSLPGTAATRTQFNLSINALDVYGNLALTYFGTIHFVSSDTNAVLPADTPLSNGTGNFLATLNTPGNQTISATDTGTPSLTKMSGEIVVSSTASLAITSAAPPHGTVHVDYGPTVTEEEGCSRGDHCGPCNGSPYCMGLPRCGAGIGYPCTIYAPVFVGFTLKAAGGVRPYTWSASSLPPGLRVDPTTGEILGTPTHDGVYTNVSFTVTDSGSPAAKASENLSMTVFAPPLGISSSNPPDGVIGTAYSATLTTVGGTNPVTWTVSAGRLPAGLQLNASAGTISGTPTSEGFFSFTVQAADSSTPQLTRTSALTITVNPQAVNNAELNGQYAFSFRGFETYGPDGIVGSFTADGKGNLTDGLQDVNKVRGGIASQSFVGTYEIFADNRGIFKLTTSPGGLDLGTFRFAIGSISGGVASKGRFVNFSPIAQNSPTQGAGIFEKQDPTAFSTAKIIGDYAFGVSAASADSSNTKFGAAGRFTASAGAISSGTIDEDNRGTVTSNAAFTGTYSVAATGRGTMALNIVGATDPVNLVFYVVSSGELLLQNSDTEGVNSLFIGTALQQSGAGTFSNASLNSASVVSLSGLTVNGPSDVVLGILTFPSAGNFSLVGDENDGGTVQALNQSGTCSVASNGRVSVTGTSQPVIFYLVGENEGFVVGTDISSTTGFIEPQTGGSLSTASLNGAFFSGVSTPGMPIPANAQVAYESGVASFNGMGSVTGATDTNSGSLFPDQVFTDTYSISGTGRGTMASSGSIFYLISPSKYVLMNGTTGAAYSWITEGEK